MELIMIPLVLIGSIAGLLIGMLIERNERRRRYVVISKDRQYAYIRVVPDVTAINDEEIVGVGDLDDDLEVKFDRRLEELE